eukprot:TRINITY_DN1798_c0_g1_i1.p1 TRINITY_DN1798_c0_g1~~TRINITY_DN1798_c0_g1_i1.p1  ORF type:complete len:278 (+),score=128.93 TRINITY_DN1798_c0_g1_i1:106-939(+)
MARPEDNAPPEIFYNEIESKKYAFNSRMVDIQSSLTQRALELLRLPENEPQLLLDIGCGSGLSGDVISRYGHTWIGLDISPSMLDVALEKEVDGDLILHDMGTGIHFRPGVFDGAISISALQWLCNSYTSEQIPMRRLKRFFTTLYMSLKRGAKAVFQFYPERIEQVDMITRAAMKAGFSGGLLVDYPNSTKAKKHFLCLFAGSDPEWKMPTALGVDEQNELAKFSKERQRNKDKRDNKPTFKSKTWVLAKKERQRKQGKQTKQDSRYTGRKRPTAF